MPLNTTCKISIIIPVYNAGQYLSQCLDSLLKQTLREIEIICVNDGSSDNSFEILKHYKTKDERIIIINQNNQGQGSARNRAIDISKGEYIAFVDPDDWVEDNMFEYMYQKAKENNCDVVYCDYKVYFEETKKFFLDYTLKKILKQNAKFSSKDIKKYYLIGIPNYTWNKIYKRQFILDNNIRFSNYKMKEDNLFSIKVRLLSKNNYYCAKSFYNYRKYKRTREYYLYSHIPIEKLIKEIDNLLKELNLKEKLSTQFSNYIVLVCGAEYNNLKKEQEEFLLYLKNKLLTKNQYKLFSDNFYNKFNLKSIFSIRDTINKEHKIITLFAIKIKLRNKSAIC